MATLTASEELRGFLNGLTDELLFQFCRETKYVEPFFVISGGSKGQKKERGNCGIDLSDMTTVQTTEWHGIDEVLRRSFDPKKERPKIIDNILQSEETDPAFFRKACRTANIRTNDARSLGIAASANCRSWWALWIAIGSAVAAIVSAVAAWKK